MLNMNIKTGEEYLSIPFCPNSDLNMGIMLSKEVPKDGQTEFEIAGKIEAPSGKHCTLIMSRETFKTLRLVLNKVDAEGLIL